MKYCAKCKKIYADSASERCTMCGKKLIADPNPFSPAAIKTANGFELERIRAALDDADIASSVIQTKHDTGLQILNSAPPENCTVYVSLCDFEEALNILIGIGAADEDTPLNLSQEDSDRLKEAKEKADSEEMTPRKQFWVRLLSALGFLLILAGVVYLTDWVMSFVKTIFGW